MLAGSDISTQCSRSSYGTSTTASAPPRGMVFTMTFCHRLLSKTHGSWPLFAVLLLPVLRLTSARADSVVDSPMYKLPDMPMPKVIFAFPQGATSLWLRALERPETDLKIQAAHAIAQAQRRGFKEVQETAGVLIKEFDRSDLPGLAKLAIAEALIALDARHAAPSLFREAKSGGIELRQVIEPALARWDHAPARVLWLERLRDPATPQRSLVLAIQSLATVREDQAADRLRELALSERITGPIRLEAARALSALRSNGLETDAERLAADASPRGMIPRLVAAALLRQHRSKAAVAILQRLAVDAEPAVAAGPVARLIEIDPDLVVPIVERLLANPDANLRAQAVTVLFRRPGETSIRLLGDRLDDVSQEVRSQARQALVDLAAKKEFRDQVLGHATRLLGTKQWRALEQATIVLTQLDHKPAAKRFVELLTFNRPEVTVTAGWGLRKLAVADTLPDATRHVETAFKQFQAGRTPPGDPLWAVDHRLSQLCQFLGQQKHLPAEPVLRRLVPKPAQPLLSEARAAAVWALGLLLAGQSKSDLAATLEQRFNDLASVPPEDERVRRMSALTLGRLRAKDALPSLRKQYSGEPTRTHVNNAAGWAIEQITGERVPPPKDLQQVQRDWFLVPN